MIILPFPPASLSGHAKGHWRAKAALTKKHRQWAHDATKAAGVEVTWEGPIHIHIHFVPPSNRGDKTNMPIRVKSQIDGIADALGKNDRLFVPHYTFAEPEKPGRVEVTITPQGAE